MMKFRAWDERKNEYHKGPIAVGEDGVIRFTENGRWLDTSFVPERSTGKKYANGEYMFECDIGRHWNYFYKRFDYYVMTWVDNDAYAKFMWLQIGEPKLTYDPGHRFTLSDRCRSEGATELIEPFGNVHTNPIQDIHNNQQTIVDEPNPQR